LLLFCGCHADRSSTCTPSGYPGDERCLTPPPSSEGLQIHVGPASRRPGDIAPFVLQPGMEVTDCFYLKSPEQPILFAESTMSLRPGMHHVGLFTTDDAQPDGLGECVNVESRRLVTASSQPGFDSHPFRAPENEGLAQLIPAHSQLVLELHGLNASTQPTLRELWLNLTKLPPSKVRAVAKQLFMASGMLMHIDPGTDQILHGRCVAPSALRLLDLSGHFHTHTQYQAAWKVVGDTRTLLYQGFDYQDPGSTTFDTITQNPPPDPEHGRAGGFSGPVSLAPGDALEWECAVHNDLDTVIEFGNSLFTKEMCLLAGFYDGAPDGWSCFVP
jgi:hypothetical protein